MQVHSTHAAEWLSRVSSLLQQRWPSVDPQRLDDVALDLFSLPEYRGMAPDKAAAKWLEPVQPKG